MGPALWASQGPVAPRALCSLDFLPQQERLQEQESSLGEAPAGLSGL